MPNRTESKPAGLTHIRYYATQIGALYADNPSRQLTRTAAFVDFHNQRLAEDPRYNEQDIKNDCRFEISWALAMDRRNKRAQGGESVA